MTTETAARMRPDLRRRLAEIHRLQPSWLEPGNPVPDPTGLDWLTDQLQSYFPEPERQPWLTATAEGNIAMEWEFGSRCCSLEVDLKSRVGYWISYSDAAPEIEEGNRNLLDLEIWQSIAAAVASFYSLGGNTGHLPHASIS